MTEVRISQKAVTSPIFRVKGQRSRWRYPDERLTPEHCEIIRNINMSERGVAESRFGYAAYNDTKLAGNEPAIGMYQTKFKDGSDRRIVLTATKAYNDDGTTRSTITGTALTGSLDQRARFEFLKNQIIFNNGKDPMRVWSGSTSSNTAALATVPFTKNVDFMVHKNLLLAAGTTEGGTYYPTRLRWCDINRKTYIVDITNWPTDNMYEIYDGGSPIVGCVDAWGKALIFKEDGLYVGEIYYDQLGHYDFRLENPIRGFSPIAKMSLIARPEFVFGIAREGAFLIRPDLTFQIISFDDDDQWRDLNQNRIQYAQSFIREKDHQVRTLLSTSANSTSHDIIMVFDWETGDISWDLPVDKLNYAQRVVIDDEELDWFGDDGGNLLQGNKSTYQDDNGTGYTWRIKMSPNDLGTPGQQKHIVNVRTFLRKRAGQQSVTFRAYIDEGRESTIQENLSLGTASNWNAGTSWNTGQPWPKSTSQREDTFINRICQTISPEWTSSDPASVEAYQVEYIPLES